MNGFDFNETVDIIRENLDYMISLLPNKNIKSIKNMFHTNGHTMKSLVYDLGLIYKRFGEDVAGIWYMHSDINLIRKGNIKKALRILKRILPLNYDVKPWASCRERVINKVIQELVDYDPLNPQENPTLYSSEKTIKSGAIKIYTTASKDIGPVEGKEVNDEISFTNENSNIIPVDVLEVEKYNKPKRASDKEEIISKTRHSVTYRTKYGTVITEFL